jgi:NAD(P)-dependent dehydrogenase (short-subunit alcohol dehydrogenase family)
MGTLNHMRNSIALVTGDNKGIGGEIARQLATAGRARGICYVIDSVRGSVLR